jgi:hypothetical protein
MQTSSILWTKWAKTLTRLKMKNLALWVLEAGEPWLFIGAQMLYVGQPFLGGKQVHDLASFLENQEETRAFAAFLRKD